MSLWFKPAAAGSSFFTAMPWLTRGWRARHKAHHRHHRWHDPETFRDRAVHHIASRLNLTSEQRDALATLVGRIHAQREALRGSTDWRADLRALVQDDTFDRWHAQDLLHARVQALREQGPQVIAAMADFYDKLDASQQARVRDWIGRFSPGR